ncbi:unnamed protein product [Ilex paraguariensis]|uniref:Uncharacterized protein n=1 Tax=Ilex paraguariensis TaxID=185542 RepID=A0ABC8TWE7_9AQUA
MCIIHSFSVLTMEMKIYRKKIEEEKEPSDLISKAAKTMAIPNDIIVKILFRQLVKSLVRFKYILKPWRSLIIDHKFFSNHVNRVARADNCEFYHHVILMDMPLSPSSPIKSINFDALSDDCEIVVKRLKLPEEFGLLNDQYKVWGNCDGLLLLCDQEINLLWNPSIRDYKILPKPNHHAHGPVACGLDYDHSSCWP